MGGAGHWNLPSCRTMNRLVNIMATDDLSRMVKGEWIFLALHYNTNISYVLETCSFLHNEARVNIAPGEIQ